MGAKDSLREFVEVSLSKGLSRASITEVLQEAGWEKQEIRGALAAYHTSDFPVPVPNKRYSLTARDTIFYLFLFITLYAVSWGLIALGFDIINLLIPAIEGYRGEDMVRSGVRYWVAYSIVFTPVYLTLAWKAERRHKLDPSCPMSSSRQWLTYFTLFIASMTVLGDMVALLYSYLSGGLTVRVFLKVAVVAAIAGLVLFYYYGDMRRAEKAGETGGD